MDKKQVAKILHEIGVLLELKGENPFKVRAYVNAARTVEMLDEDIAKSVKTGEIRNVKGIGSALAEKITQLVTTGDLPYYNELKSSVPDGLLEMLRIPGLGPKKIYRLYKILGITGVAELEYACRENRLLVLKGFGEKSQESILRGIEHIKKFLGRFLYGDIIGQAEDLVVQLDKCSEIKEISIAGGLRRCKEIVKDIDIVASSGQAKKVMEFFAVLPKIAEVTASGETKTTVTLDKGVSADLQVVALDEFPYALHHFTGSKEHNTAMRHRAKGMGLKINEYGLFKDDQRIDINDEAEFFNMLGLDYIPPELRENMGEIEAAERAGLPDLVKAEDITGTFHVHTNYSDGINTLEEMVAEARRAGFKYLGISEHSQTASYAGGLKVDKVRRQHKEIKEFNKKNPDFTVFHGIESDIHADGSLDYPDEILALFDFVIASVHSGFSITGERATGRLIKAMENPHVNMLGHPTGRLLLGRSGYDPDMVKIIKAAKENNVIIELNASPFRLDIDWRHLKFAGEQGVIVSINPDAHRKEDLCDTFIGVGIARKGWLEKENVFNSWPVEKVKGYLAER